MPTTAMMIEALVQHRAKDPSGCAMPTDYFWQLVERFKADLVNQAFAILGNVPDAEDVAQAFLHQALELKTTGDVTTVDGGNIAAALR